MKFYIVAFATVFAMFWDEAAIILVTAIAGRKLNSLFIIVWMICSGLLTSVLIAYHVSAEYRVLTIVMLTFAVFFSLQGYLATERNKHSNN